MSRSNTPMGPGPRPHRSSSEEHPSLLAAKLLIPPVPPVHLPRTRLIDPLTDGCESRLTAVTAPAGAGKTVLVSSWARTGLSPAPVAWLTLDDRDNVPAIFWSYVLAALRIHVPDRLGADLVTSAGSLDRAFLGTLATRLAESAAPVVLVLDRCENITSRAIASDLDLLVQYSERGLRLMLVGRSARILPLHRYRLAGQLTEIGPEALALRVDEITDLFDRYGVRSGADEAHRVLTSTEGWMTGVCLHAHARQTEGTALGGPTSRYTRDFLRSEVLDRQPARARDLLLRTSIVDDIEPSLADRLTGRFDGRGILDELVRANSFVRTAGEDSYRVHPLFHDLLHDELTARASELLRHLHNLAARWYAEQDRIPDALQHATRVEDWQFAADLAVRRLGVAWLLTAPGADILRDLFAGLPDTEAGAEAALVRAVLALARFDTATARAELDLARTEHAAEQGGDLPVQLGVAVLDVVHGRMTGDTADAERAAADADALWALLSPDELADGPRIRSLLRANLGAALLWAGDVAAARRTLDAAATAHEPGTEYSVHDALGHLALLELNERHLHKADTYARESIAVAERAGLRIAAQSGAARTALAGVALYWNDMPAVREHLSRAIASTSLRHDPTTAVSIALVRSHAASGRGDGRRALAAAHSARTTVTRWHVPANVDVQVDLATARAYIALGDPESARKYAERVPEGPEHSLVLASVHVLEHDPAEARRLVATVTPHSAPRDVLQRIALLRAQLATADDDELTAERSLRDALEYGRSERFRRPFAEAGSWLWRLIRQHPDLVTEHDWLSPHKAETGAGPVPTSSVVVEHLTAREVEVLRRLAQAMSTEDIATELYLSVNTVKTHLKSIYRKLGTSGRSATARRARELKLLDATEPAERGSADNG